MSLGRWGVAFLLTQAMEIPIWAFALARNGPTRSLGVRLELAFLASMLTHPWVWFAFPALTTLLENQGVAHKTAWSVMIFCAEMFAWLVEARLMARFGLRNATFWSAIANATSYTAGRIAWGILF